MSFRCSCGMSLAGVCSCRGRCLWERLRGPQGSGVFGIDFLALGFPGRGFQDVNGVFGGCLCWAKVVCGRWLEPVSADVLDVCMWT